MKKSSYFDAVLRECMKHCALITDKQIERLRRATEQNHALIVTLDDYLDIYEIERERLTDNVRNVFSRRVKFKKMLYCNVGRAQIITPQNFGFIWSSIAPRKPIERDETPERPYFSKIFNDAQPERKQPKACKHGYLRITQAYQSMENLSTLIKGAH